MTGEEKVTGTVRPPTRRDPIGTVLTLIGVAFVLAGVVGLSLAASILIGEDTATLLRQKASNADGLPDLQYELVVEGLMEPIAATFRPGTDWIFVIERAGKVRLVLGDRLRPDPVLDISDQVFTEALEQGLLGIALHPEFDANGRVFLTYTDLEQTLRLVEFTIAGQGDAITLDPASERLLLTVEQRGMYHQGGSLAFGPDGYLWVGFGDGGGNADPDRHGQNPNTLQGTISRIDVNSGDPYGIPPTNPFADGVGGAPEVWAYGFRNPWRFTFDREVVYVADVGEYEYEEINRIRLDQPGGFYGWSIWEGPQCFRPGECVPEEAIFPNLSFFHEGLCAIVGGPVYRGALMPALNGHYFHADFCNGFVESVVFVDGQPVTKKRWDSLEWIRLPTSFFTDDSGEMYLMHLSGEIRKLVPAAP